MPSSCKFYLCLRWICGIIIAMILGRKGEYDSRAIANRFVDKAKAAGKLAAPKEIPRYAERKLDIMTLLKFVYFAHGWYLAYADKTIDLPSGGMLAAWPSHPTGLFCVSFPRDVYSAAYAKDLGLVWPYVVDLDHDKQATGIIDFVYKNYSPLSAVKLSEITHREGTPWQRNVDFYRHAYGQIANDTIKQYYKKYKDAED